MWDQIITTTTASNTSGTFIYLDVGTEWTTTVSPWTFNGDAVYAEKFDGDTYIKVDKGSPDKARYVIFYAVNKKDPMIFCKTRRDLYKEVKKLLKREEVDIKSIRIFALVGGAKKALHHANK